MLERVDAALCRVEKISETVSVVSLFSIMVLLGADVFGRYVLNAPLGITYSLTTLYLMISLFFLGFAPTLRSNNHISVDLFVGKMSPSVQRLFAALNSALCAPIFFYLAGSFAIASYESFVKGETVFGVIMWPVWPPLLVVAAGLLLLAVRLTLNTFTSLVMPVADVGSADVDRVSAQNGGTTP